MSSFEKYVADLCGLPEASVFRQMPGDIILDRVGDGLPRGPLKSAMLCTARSGSSLLSVALQAYGFDFQEFLNAKGRLREVVADNDVKTVSELVPHFADKATVDGRMSIKCPANGLPLMFAMGEFPQNLDQWRFIYLRRENLVRQAISGFIAQKTGLWTTRMKAIGEVTEDDYSFDDILRLAGAYAQGNKMIERFVGLLGLPTYNVVYEEFLQDQKRILADIAQFLGCDIADYPEAATHEPWLERQATELNDIWEQRFRAELIGQFDTAEVSQVA